MEENAYRTKQKQYIYDFLKENCERSFTIDEITERIAKQNASVGRTTVYRNVEKLAKSGEVRKFVDQKGKSSTYQYVEHHTHCSEHIHLKCISCGKFIHLDCEMMDSVNEHILDEHGFSIDNSKSLLFGLCKNCMREKNNVID